MLIKRNIPYKVLIANKFKHITSVKGSFKIFVKTGKPINIQKIKVCLCWFHTETTSRKQFSELSAILIRSHAHTPAGLSCHDNEQYCEL